MIYYTGSFDFAFGGDSSRPKFSVLRIYNQQYPEGRDIVRFSFKAGTVVDVRKTEHGFGHCRPQPACHGGQTPDAAEEVETGCKLNQSRRLG